MRGTPALAGEAERGNIKSLGKLTETDKRKAMAQKQREAMESKAASAARASEASKAAPSAGQASRASSKAAGLLPPLPGDGKAGAVPEPKRVAFLLQLPSRKEVADSDFATDGPTEEPKAEAGSASQDEAASNSTPRVREEPWDSVSAEVVYPPDGEPASGPLKLGAAEASSAAAQVKSLVSKLRKDAWVEFKLEFDVQSSVWESAAMLRGRGSKIMEVSKRPEGPLYAKLEAATAASETDPALSVRLLQEVVAEQLSGEGLVTIGPSLVKVAERCIKVHGTSMLRDKLRVLLEAARQKEASTDPDVVQELDNLVTSCELDDSKTEYLARRALGLPMSVNKLKLQNDPRLDGVDIGDLMGFLSGSFRSQSTDPWA